MSNNLEQITEVRQRLYDLSERDVPHELRVPWRKLVANLYDNLARNEQERVEAMVTALIDSLSKERQKTVLASVVNYHLEHLSSHQDLDAVLREHMGRVSFLLFREWEDDPEEAGPTEG